MALVAVHRGVASLLYCFGLLVLQVLRGPAERMIGTYGVMPRESSKDRRETNLNVTVLLYVPAGVATTDAYPLFLMKSSLTSIRDMVTDV